MENATNALHMAFAVFIFVFAIGLAFTTFSSARQVADIVLYTNDKTNYDERIDASSTIRNVGLEAIIPTIRAYVTDNEGYAIRFIDNTRQNNGSKSIDFSFDIKEQKFQLTDFGINTLNGLRVYRDQLIVEPNAFNEYMQDCLDVLSDLYKNQPNALFRETYKEKIISGGRQTMADGEEVEQLIEKSNTETKVFITYIRVQ